MQQHKQVPRMNLFYTPNSSYINQNVARKCPPPITPPQFYGHVEIMIVFGGIVSLIYHRPKWILY